MRRNLLWVSAIFLLAGILVSCGSDNVARLPKPAESDPQFVIERSFNNTSCMVYAVRDKVNGNLFYMSQGCGLAIGESGYNEPRDH